MQYSKLFIHKYLNQRMDISVEGVRYEATRTDSDGYKIKLLLDQAGSIIFEERMLNSGWEISDGY